jgi:hypothetical protein
MALIIRIDVDRPYGRQPVLRHALSRISSDFYLPTLPAAGYLAELKTTIQWLNHCGARACVFFRRCTLPCQDVLRALYQGGHEIGLHLENSRSFATFAEEVRLLECHIGRRVQMFSKHGSGGRKFGFHHYPPYEPDRYIRWANDIGMRLFLGNLQDPRLVPERVECMEVFPSAFWLEPPWRDTAAFPVEWLMDYGQRRDIVLLIHPENVLAQPHLIDDFRKLTATLPSRVFS